MSKKDDKAPRRAQRRRARRKEGRRRARRPDPASPLIPAPAIRSAAPRAGAESPASRSPAYLSYKAGVPTFDVGLRALVAGIVGYMLAWACAVTRVAPSGAGRAARGASSSQDPNPDLIPRAGAGAGEGPRPGGGGAGLVRWPPDRTERPWIRCTRSSHPAEHSAGDPGADGRPGRSRRRANAGAATTSAAGAARRPPVRLDDGPDYPLDDADDDDDSGLHINVTA